MAIEILTTIRNFSGNNDRPAVVDRFLRHEYSSDQLQQLTLPANIKTLVPLSFTDVKLLYIRCDTGGPVQVYRNLSPEYWTFADTFFVIELSDCYRVCVKASVATTLTIYAAGS